jgi:hypothetical protein
VFSHYTSLFQSYFYLVEISVRRMDVPWTGVSHGLVIRTFNLVVFFLDVTLLSLGLTLWRHSLMSCIWSQGHVIIYISPRTSTRCGYSIVKRYDANASLVSPRACCSAFMLKWLRELSGRLVTPHCLAVLALQMFSLPARPRVLCLHCRLRPVPIPKAGSRRTVL